jgi:hypothetical protein
MTGTFTGYLHPSYAGSLAEFGGPRELPRSRGWLLTRPVSNSAQRDAMSCYPLFFCADWAALATDLEEVKDLISATVVTEPFADATPEQLKNAFPDLVRPFKEHFVIDLHTQAPSSHHRRTARRALRDLSVEVAENPVEHLEEWQRIYTNLCARRAVTGMRAFSAAAFQNQLSLPGCVLFCARLGAQCVAMNLWYVMGEIAYGHLLAADEDGYRRSAPYALIQTALNTFSARGLRWMVLGGGPGENASDDGVVWFKKGWATGTRQTYLCGRIFSHAEYARLAEERGVNGTGYFPAYRQGEFA